MAASVASQSGFENERQHGRNNEIYATFAALGMRHMSFRLIQGNWKRLPASASGNCLKISCPDVDSQTRSATVVGHSLGRCLGRRKCSLKAQLESAGIDRNTRMKDFIKQCKTSAVEGMEMFLRNFSHVPDDKLTWQATPSAKTPIRIAAHTALYAARFAGMIRDRQLPGMENLEEWLAQRNTEEEALTSRVEMEAAFRKGTEEVLTALDTLTPELIESSLDSGQGWSMPMTFLMKLPGWHATLHTGQIDFLQTCWDDQEIYVG